VLVLSQADVASIIDMPRLIDVVEAAMIDLSAGTASVPPRVGAFVAERSAVLAAMPAYLPSVGALTSKLVSVFPQNRDRPTHQAIICCFDPDDGTPIAVMDGTLITAMRTAAGSASATRALARSDAEVVAIVGTGVQAHAHIEAMKAALRRPRFLVGGRDRERARALADEIAGVAADSIEEAVRAADIVCLATHAEAPVVRREWLRPGAHVNSVGYNTQGIGEVDRATVTDAYVVVESRAAAFAPPPAGAVELLDVIGADDTVEIGEVLRGARSGRRDDAAITLYKSVGVAVQDAAAASYVLTEARARGAGTEVAL
jgi:ornithine cyclodeaminase